MLMAVKRRLHLYRSPRKRLSSPTARSNRLRGAMRGGLWSSFSVLMPGTLMNVEPNCVAGHSATPGTEETRLEVMKVPVGFDAEGGAGKELPQKKPASNSWSALSGFPNGSSISMPPVVGSV